MGDFVPLAAAIALAWKLVDFVKFVRARDTNGIVTQLAVWVAGVVVVFLLAATDFADGIAIGDKALGSMNAASLLFIGLGFVGSSASVIYDFKRARDNTDTAATPMLVPTSEPTVPRVGSIPRA